MSDNEPEKGKKKFKMPNTYVILFGVISASSPCSAGSCRAARTS